MKKLLLLSVLFLVSLVIIELTTNASASLQTTIAPRLLQAAQQQGILRFPTPETPPPPPSADSSTTPAAATPTDILVSTPPVTTDIPPAPTSTAGELSPTTSPVPSPSSEPIATLTSGPVITSIPIGSSQTRQADWVYNGQGVCWSAWAGNQCSLQAHEGGATTVARDLNRDGVPDITCSQGDGSNRSTTITNDSNQPITISCERYQCNNCASGNGSHAQCDGNIDPDSMRISEEIIVEPGCTLTCTYDGVTGSCGSVSQPPPMPTGVPDTVPPVTTPSFSPPPISTPPPIPSGTPDSVSPTTPPLLPTAAPSVSPEQEEQVALISSMLEQISVERIRGIIENLQDDDEIEGKDSLQTRYAGTSGNTTEAAYIKSELESYGLQVTEQQFDRVDSVLTSFTCPAGTNMKNIVARIPGTNTEEVYMIVGHFDSTSDAPDHDPAPGADDNATGTAAILEIARSLALLHNQRPFTTTVEFILFDAEELGLCGSSYYVSQLDQTGRERIKGVINMDMIGYTPVQQTCSLMNYSPSDERSLLIARHVAAMNDRYGIATTGLAQASTQRNSDHASFWNINVAAVSINECYIEQNPNYHRTTDTLEFINMTQIEFVTRSVAAAVAEYAFAVSIEETPQQPEPTTAPAPEAPAPDAPAGDTIQEMLRLFNQERAKVGAGTLTFQPELAKAAQMHSTDLAQNRSTPCGHYGSDGSGPLERIRKTTYTATAFQEIVSCGAGAPEMALQGWLNSPGHKNALLNPSSTHVGIASATGANRYTIWTAVFGNSP